MPGDANGYQLVIDQGGQSTRLIVFDHSGSALFSESLATPQPLSNKAAQQTLSDQVIEYDPEPFIDSTRLLLNKLLHTWSDKHSRYSLNDIDSVSIIAQRSSLIACDKASGKALTPMISWQDTRHHRWLQEQGFDQVQLQQLTGLRLNAHAGASKMRYLLDNNALIAEKAQQKKLLFMPWGAYFLQRLINQEKNQPFQAITDPILASRTYLTEYQQLNWSKKLVALFGLSTNMLPAIVPSHYHYGHLRLGDYRIPVTLLGGDQNFIRFAYGSRFAHNSIFLNMGSGAFLQAGIHKPAKNTDLLKTCAAIEKDKTSEFMIEDTIIKGTTIEGTINAAATAINWQQEKMAQAYSHQQLNELLNTDTNAPIFINALAGVGSPYWLAQQPNEFIALTGHNKPFSDREKMQAILESILFLCVINARELIKHNSQLDKIIISGGLSNMGHLCQQLANLITLPVHRYQDTEASARGVVFYRNENTVENHLNMHKQIYRPKDALMPSYSRLIHNLSFFKNLMETLASDARG